VEWKSGARWPSTRRGDSTPVDVQDIEGVVFRQREALDSEYIRRWLREFAAILESSEVLERFEIPWRQLRRA